MAQQNSTLDDIAAVIGFTPTIRLAAWYGDTDYVYVPVKAEEGQMLVRLLGMPAARKMSETWPGESVGVPKLHVYDQEVKRRLVCSLIAKGLSTKDASLILKLGERRIQQICRELEREGMLEIVAPKTPRKKATGK